MPKNQTKASTPVPAQESRSPVSFDVRVYPVKDSKYTLANANVDINGVFAIRGVKVIRGEKGPFVAMPQYKDSHGDYGHAGCVGRMCRVLFQAGHRSTRIFGSCWRRSCGSAFPMSLSQAPREIAKVLGLSLPTAIKLDQRAKSRLKKMCEEEGIL